MTLPAANRKVHYWLSAAVALPVLVTLVTGVLLQLKKQLPWVQPPERRGTAAEPSVSFERVLDACRSVPEAGVSGWGDVARVDVRPARGLVKVTTRGNWEVQLDAATGEVLQVAYRRSDVIEALHDGSWFSDAVKAWVFLPAGVALLVLWVTGVYLFARPLAVNLRRGRWPGRPR